MQLAERVPSQVDAVAEVPPRSARASLTAPVRWVFLTIGESTGVRVGNRVFITREGDAWRDNRLSRRVSYGETVENAGEPREYPPEVLAEGTVVDVRKARAPCSSRARSRTSRSETAPSCAPGLSRKAPRGAAPLPGAEGSGRCSRRE